MRKILSIVLLGLIVIVMLAGCGKEAATDVETSKDVVEQTTQANESKEETSETEETTGLEEITETEETTGQEKITETTEIEEVTDTEVIIEVTEPSTTVPETVHELSESPFPGCVLIPDACEPGTIATINQYCYSYDFDKEFRLQFKSGTEAAMALLDLRDGRTGIYSQPDNVIRLNISEDYNPWYIPTTYKIAIEGPDNTYVLTGRAYDTNGGDYMEGTTFMEVEYNGGVAYIPVGALVYENIK